MSKDNPRRGSADQGCRTLRECH